MGALAFSHGEIAWVSTNQKVRGWWWNITIPYFWNESTYFLCLRHCFFVVGVWGVVCVSNLGVIWSFQNRAFVYHHHQASTIKTNPCKPRCAWKTVTFASCVCKPLPLNAVATGKPPNLSTMDTIVFPAEVPSSVASTRWRVGVKMEWRNTQNTFFFLEQHGWVYGHHNLSTLLQWRCFCWTYSIRAFQKKSRKGWNERLGLTYLHFGQQKTCRSHPGISPCFPGTQK